MPTITSLGGKTLTACPNCDKLIIVDGESSHVAALDELDRHYDETPACLEWKNTRPTWDEIRERFAESEAERPPAPPLPTTHTPGPWSYYDRGGMGYDLEGVPDADRGYFENEYDAMLAAAAPDLLAACRESLAMVDDAYIATGHIRVAKTSEQRLRLEAAIAKATNRDQAHSRD